MVPEIGSGSDFGGGQTSRRAGRPSLLVVTFLMSVLVSLPDPPAVALGPSRQLTQYADARWGVDDGLPQSSVLALAQTDDGYLWLGTEQGLARFDGVRFVPFELRTSGGAIDGFVSALCDDAGTLWVGTSRGLYRLDDGVFVEQRTADGSVIGDVESILRDRSGRLWVAAMDGVLRDENGHLRPFVDADGTRLEHVTALAESAEGRLCVAAEQVMCLEGGTFEEVAALTAASAGARVEWIAFDGGGALWAGTTGRGLLRFADGEVRVWDTSNGLPADWVLRLMADREGSVWFGCGVEELARISDRGLEVLPTSAGGSGEAVASLLEDREGNLWVGRFAGGLERLSALPFVPFSTAEGLEEPTVRAVLEDRDGVVWVGTAGGGLHRLENDRFVAVGTDTGLEPHDVLALAESRDGRLWVGTGGGGVYVREGGHYRRVSGAGLVAFALHEDPDGRMWAGGIGHVSRLVDGRFEAVAELSGINATAIVGRENGEVWFANAQGGVVRWRDGRVDRPGAEKGLDTEVVLSLYADDRGVIWAGTHLGGLYAVDGAETAKLTTEQGLCDNSVFSIVEDLSGRIWMTSNLGVFSVLRDQLEAVVQGRASRVDCRLFGVADGMRSNECNGGQQPVAWRDRAGRLWFATVDGVVRVDPRDVEDGEPPPVVVEELVANGRPFSQPPDGRELGLPPGRGSFSVRFTALTLTAPERVEFRHRLEGRDRDWVEDGAQRVAHYADLRARSYRFRVQARLPGGSWSEPGGVVAFRIGPRFYQTRWFLALLLLAVAGMVVTAHRTRVAVLERRQRHLEGVVTERTRELETARGELEHANATLELRVERAVEALRESDRMAAYGHLVAGVAHEVRHPILAIRTVAHLLARKLEGREETCEELDILERETERMSQLVDDLLELGRPRELELRAWPPVVLVEEAVASFRAESDTELAVETVCPGSLPPVQADRPAIVQVLLNLLHNARRHALGARRVVVGASLDGDAGRVRLTVADDGQGIPRRDQPRVFEPFFSTTGSTGLGLAIAHRLVREHGGRLSVSSSPGEGAVFTLELVVAEGAPRE